MKKKLLLMLSFPLYCIGQVPEYYSTIDFNQSGEDLKEQITGLVTITHTNELIYTPDVWNALKLADLDPENPENVLLIYGYNDTDAVVSNDRTRDKDLSCHTSGCTGLWVREHVFPRSLGDPNLGDDGPGSDAHHLRAVDSQMNNSRSNREFADGSGNASVLGNGYFYPGDEWKGDVARMIMYMYIRYQDRCLPLVVGVGSSDYSDLGDMPDIFLEWNEEDPVSPYEINRNTVLQNMQGNRNPFIDNPYIATMIWNGPAAADPWGVLSGTSVAAAEERSIVYPTLTTGVVYIQDTTRDYSLALYNSLGQNVQFTASDNSIDIGNNTKGIYYLMLHHDNASTTYKLVLK